MRYVQPLSKGQRQLLENTMKDDASFRARTRAYSLLLKSCLKTLSRLSRGLKIRGYEAAKVLEPEPTGEENTSPPCCASTH